ncbi:MAG: NgoFVII family restriction endonuclease, partial [Chloroflexi bacterium]|nr:NgoFVII family restriction endonuclease [Chloroflexota bacterium]
MPRIFDNISEKLLTALQNTMQSAERADFCVGYFNLRGWRLLHTSIDQLSGEDSSPCRILIGMHTAPQDELQRSLSLRPPSPVDNTVARRRKEKIVENFRRQLTFGAPTNDDEQGLRDLVRQLRACKVS